MGIDTVLVPKLASGLCASGQIISGVKYNFMATAPMRLDTAAAYARLNALFARIEADGQRHLAADGFGPDRIRAQRSIEMRHVGQVHECTVEIGAFEITAETVGRIKDAFHARHEQLFTDAERHNTVEVVNVETTLYGLIDTPAAPGFASGGIAAPVAHRDAIFAADGTATSTPIYDGAILDADARVAGPAIIEEETTTIVIEPGWTADLHAGGAYRITRDRTLPAA